MQFITIDNKKSKNGDTQTTRKIIFDCKWGAYGYVPYMKAELWDDGKDFTCTYITGTDQEDGKIPQSFALHFSEFEFQDLIKDYLSLGGKLPE